MREKGYRFLQVRNFRFAAPESTAEGLGKHVGDF
jgi:hypothetical protein